MSSGIQKNKAKTGISSLYLLKAVCAFLVVVIHADLCCKEELSPILGMATPCFMSITGYLLYSDDKKKELSKALRWAKKALWLSIVLNLLHLGQHLWDGAALADYTIHGLIFNLFTGITFSTHLWYLSALWTGLLLFYLLRRHLPVLIFAAPLLYCWAHVCYKWGAAIFPQAEAYQLFLMRCNGLITGLPYLCTGYLIARYQAHLTTWRHLWLYYMLCLVMLFRGSRLIPFTTYGWLHFVTMYLFIGLTMVLCLRYKNARIPLLNEIGQYHSANIYFFHILVLIHLGRTGVDTTGWQAIAVYLCSIPVSWCINHGATSLKRLRFSSQSQPSSSYKP